MAVDKSLYRAPQGIAAIGIEPDDIKEFKSRRNKGYYNV